MKAFIAVLALLLAPPAVGQTKIHPDMIGPVTSTGGTTARALKDRFADVVNVKDYGAVGDGVADDTAGIQAAYDSLPATGGVIAFPAGVFKFNLTIAKRGVRIVGASQSDWSGNESGTRFRAWNPALPVIQFGDGLATVRGGGLEHVAILGDSTTVGSEGLVIYGARNLFFLDVHVNSFKGDNIRITSSATQSTTHVDFVKLRSSTSRAGAAFKVVYGPSFTTAVKVSHFTFSDYPAAGSRTLYLDGATVYLASGWIDSTDGYGAYLTGGSKIVGAGVAIDSGASTDAIVEVNAAPGYVSDYLNGSVTVDGVIKWNDASTTAEQSHDLISARARLYRGYVGFDLGFGNADAPDESESLADISAVRLYRTGAAGSGTEKINLAGADFSSARSVLAATRIASARVSVTYGASMAIDAKSGNVFDIRPTDGAAFTIANPTNGVNGQQITIRVFNTTGGALGAVTWGTSKYKLAAWTQPATGFSRSITFAYDSTTTHWVEIGRTPADVPAT